MKTIQRSLNGKLTLITGASRGIGRAIALDLAQLGAKLLLTATSEQGLGAVADEIEAQGYGRPLIQPADLTCEADLHGLVQTAEQEWGHLDILINNAGITLSGPLEQTTTEQWDRCMAINVRGAFILCRECLPLLRQTEDASIVNISSVVGIKGYAHQTAYSASKHALRGFSIALAAELHPEGIRVHTVCPGGVDTDMVSQVRPDIPKDALIGPQEVAAWITFLLTRAGTGVVDEIRIRRQRSGPWF